jgi:hypothetical protein
VRLAAEPIPSRFLRFCLCPLIHAFRHPW